jgi:hypothetical protein
MFVQFPRQSTSLELTGQSNPLATSLEGSTLTALNRATTPLCSGPSEPRCRWRGTVVVLSGVEKGREDFEGLGDGPP